MRSKTVGVHARREHGREDAAQVGADNDGGEVVVGHVHAREVRHGAAALVYRADAIQRPALDDKHSGDGNAEDPRRDATGTEREPVRARHCNSLSRGGIRYERDQCCERDCADGDSQALHHVIDDGMRRRETLLGLRTW